MRAKSSGWMTAGVRKYKWDTFSESGARRTRQGPTGIGGQMFYWLGVYLLVAIVVGIAFSLLYFVGILFWLGFTAIRSLSCSLRDTLSDEALEERIGPVIR
jgi:hypothetical protein